MSSTWQEKNPEKWREYKNAYYLANREKIIAKKKEWCDLNREKIRAESIARAPQQKAWRDENRARLIPNELLRNARRRSKLKGIECTIKLADITVPEFCPLLGVKLKTEMGATAPNSPSLDRMDNSKGYIPGNVWVISHQANAAKGGLTADQLILLGTRLKATLEEGAVS
jgi:hypothetical protein